MKIITDGTPWYVGKEGQCGDCGCKVVLELYDNPKFYCPPTEGACHYRIDCPQCDSCIRIERAEHEWPQPITQKKLDEVLEAMQ